jgi:arginase
MNVDLIVVPYDSGRRGYRMGAGPEAFLADGLPERLARAGHGVRVAFVEENGGAAADPTTSAFDLAVKIEAAVADASARESFPLVLAGNCINTVGAMAALGGPDLGLAWFDAHGDINTPATSSSGFLDGMSLATLLGWCHTRECAQLAGFAPLDPSRIVLIGTRDLDPPELKAAQRAALRILSPEDAATEGSYAHTLDAFAAGLDRVYLHIDLDVLDPAEHGPANGFAAPGGLSLQQLTKVVRAIAERAGIAGITVSAYDPAVDTHGHVRAAAMGLLDMVVSGISMRNPAVG